MRHQTLKIGRLKTRIYFCSVRVPRKAHCDTNQYLSSQLGDFGKGERKMEQSGSTPRRLALILITCYRACVMVTVTEGGSVGPTHLPRLSVWSVDVGRVKGKSGMDAHVDWRRRLRVRVYA